MTADRQHRHTFDREAALYASVRPGYPEALFEDIITLSKIPVQGRIRPAVSSVSSIRRMRPGSEISEIPPIHLEILLRKECKNHPFYLGKPFELSQCCLERDFGRVLDRVSVRARADRGECQ